MKYGTRWSVIAKYYDVRSSEFLDAEYTSDEKLVKRRLK